MSLRNWTLVFGLLVGHVFPEPFANPLPRLAVRQADSGLPSCDSWLNIYDSCTAATPGFETLAVSVEASCLCYSAGSWQPTVYDEAWVTCVEYLSTASPALYSSLGGDSLTTDLCQQQGDVVATPGGGIATISSSAPATAGPTITSPSVPTNTGACISFNNIEESCALATPSFTALEFSEEASCLCYASGTYAPSLFDGYWGACLGFYSTASPAFYSSLGGDELTRTPCADVGDLMTSGGSPTTSLPPTTPAITSSPTEAPNPNTLVTAVTFTTTAKGNPAANLEATYLLWALMLGLGWLMF